MNHKRCFFIFALTLVITISLGVLAEARVSLSVQPAVGGTNLRFGKIDPLFEEHQEVRVRITSDEASQYQVFQSMIEPLTNERGQRLDVFALQTYSLPGSNSLGSLYLQQISPMRQVDDLVYSSTRTGQSDSFSLVYALDSSKINAFGRFSGKILYTVRPISEGVQQQVYLDVFVDILENFKIETRASSGKDLVRLTAGERADEEAYFEIAFSGNSGEAISIYEEIDRFPSNELNEEIDRNAFYSVVFGQENSVLSRGQIAPFSRGRSIYSSQKSSDNVMIYYELDKDVAEKQKAGTYRGQIKYIVERQSGTKIFFLNIEIIIDPVFEVQVQFPEGAPRFDNILPNSPPQIREAVVEVKTNLRKPYILIQKNLSPLANSQGVVFDHEFFDMKIEPLEGVGKNFLDDFKSVLPKEQSLFSSNAKGEPAKVRIFYRLRPYPGMEAGDYATSIVYSLGEM